jgi:molybdopterin converting factor small subunit
MKVHVRAYATLAGRVYRKGLRAGSTVEIEIQNGGLIKDLLDVLKLPSSETKIVFVNGRARDFDYALSEGDHVGLFPPLGGG